MLLQTEAARNRVVGMEDAMASEAVGFPARAGDIDVFAVLAGDFGITEDTAMSDSIMNAHRSPTTVYTYRTYFSVLTNGRPLTFHAYISRFLVGAEINA
jgi:hypothetical protein